MINACRRAGPAAKNSETLGSPLGFVDAAERQQKTWLHALYALITNEAFVVNAKDPVSVSGVPARLVKTRTDAQTASNILVFQQHDSETREEHWVYAHAATNLRMGYYDAKNAGARIMNQKNNYELIVRVWGYAHAAINLNMDS